MELNLIFTIIITLDFSRKMIQNFIFITAPLSYCNYGHYDLIAMREKEILTRLLRWSEIRTKEASQEFARYSKTLATHE